MTNKEKWEIINQDRCQQITKIIRLILIHFDFTKTSLAIALGVSSNTMSKFFKSLEEGIINYSILHKIEMLVGTPLFFPEDWVKIQGILDKLDHYDIPEEFKERLQNHAEKIVTVD